jgi:hypothetical protein
MRVARKSKYFASIGDIYAAQWDHPEWFTLPFNAWVGLRVFLLLLYLIPGAIWMYVSDPQHRASMRELRVKARERRRMKID